MSRVSNGCCRWTAATCGEPRDPPNRRVPRKLQSSSPSVHGSTRICGRSNWISRTLNGSSLKRPLRLDPVARAGETLFNNKSGGHSACVRSSRDATRDGKLPRREKRKYSRVVSLRFSGDLPHKYGTNVGYSSIGAALLCCV